MKLKREAAGLKAKAVASLRRATRAFNDLDEDGRVSTVLLHLQHSFEMLLKAALTQRGVRVFDPKTGRSFGFEKCVNLAREHISITDEEARTLRAIDALRDDEQHWMTEFAEGLLYVHARAGVTLFDDLLQRAFSERLVDHLPHRVLPVSAEPPRDIQLLFDDEYTAIGQLLTPGRRKRPEARARIRSLLAMEAHARDDEVVVSKRDVDRVERAVKAGGTRDQVFPALSTVAAEVAGEGVQVTVRFTKTVGAPVKLVAAGEDVAAGSVREVDLQRKYHWSKGEIAEKLALPMHLCLALRRHLGIDDEDRYRHDFTFGSQTHRRYSDNAYTAMREALDGGVDLDEVWRLNRPGRQHPPDPGAASVA